MVRTVANIHNEWLKLIEVSGPFLSLKVMMEVFPQGLSTLDSPEIRGLLKSAYQEWQDTKSDSSIHQAWIKFILNELLNYKHNDSILLEGQSIPENLRLIRPSQSEIISPDFVLKNPDSSGENRMLIKYYPPTQNLESAVKDSYNGNSPIDVMIELCRVTGVKLGLVTNGEAWSIVHAPLSENSSFAIWYSNLWIEEPVTLSAFLNLLGLQRFFGVADNDKLEQLFIRSAEDQQEVTDQLGRQVKEAVEILIRTFDKIDMDLKRKLLKDTPESEIYEAALSIMMRLVLMFCAEERGLFPLNNQLYTNNYALSSLRAQLRENADKKGEEVLERHHDAWARLLATFRMVHSGVNHEYLVLPAYGGSLFDPDRFPFLEGRDRNTNWTETPSNPLPVDNRTVLHLLEALQVLRINTSSGKETRYLSFRSLDPEQIGHVYEGLLDHTVKKAQDTVLGILGTTKKGSDIEPEIELSVLEKYYEKSEDDLIKFLKEKTGKSEAALKKLFDKRADFAEYQLLKSACNNDESIFSRVEKFSGFIRKDTFGHYYIIHPGGFFVTEGNDRRSTGTHYTPRSLSEPVVKYTLEPLVYKGVAEGKPESEWQLKSSREILDLKICDIAMGSGAFLVQACRYLAEKLVESWGHSQDITLPASKGDLITSSPNLEIEDFDSNEVGRSKIDNLALPTNSPFEGGSRGMSPLTVYGEVSQGKLNEYLVPVDSEEKLIYAKRLVATHCLYGVDKNHMAVEMAKLSMWLTTLDQNKPFTFLDHNLRCGDSLLGIADFEQIQNFHLNPEKGLEIHRWVGGIRLIAKQAVDKAVEMRKRIENLPAFDINGIREKEYLLKKSEETTQELKLYADLLVGSGLHTAGKKSLLDGEIQDIGLLVEIALNSDEEKKEQKFKELRSRAKRLLGVEPSSGQQRKAFHWILEFPEIFISDKKGFDGIVGNPPFLGGQKITGISGTNYRDYVIDNIANGIKGSADLCAYFFLRINKLIGVNGSFGLIATNTIAQGDTREVGLDQIVKDDFNIIRAIQSQKWPGAASLEVSLVWAKSGEWNNKFILDSKEATSITSYLTEGLQITANPYKLKSNENQSFQGSTVLSLGFILSIEEAKALIENEPFYKNVVFPYLSGDELNSDISFEASRWIINFFDWPLSKETAPDNYSGDFASDYPICLKIVENKVKVDREKALLKSRNNDSINRAKNWWHYGRKAIELYKSISTLNRVLAVPTQATKYLAFGFVNTNMIYSNSLAIISSDNYFNFASLNNSFHEIWSISDFNKSTLETRIRYNPTDHYQTFPFPENLYVLEKIGKEYYEYRQSIMQTRQEGLTDIYNHFHNKNDYSSDVKQLRELHVEIDKAVAKAYGWDDLNLDHSFHQTKYGIRFTVSESARREILDRLLRLNHERYAEEVAQGLHDKKIKKEASKPKPKKAKKEVEENKNLSLFDMSV